MRTGRPLRFLALVLGGWTALRVALLMPDAPSLAMPADAQPPEPPRFATLALPGPPRLADRPTRVVAAAAPSIGSEIARSARRTTATAPVDHAEARSPAPVRGPPARAAAAAPVPTLPPPLVPAPPALASAGTRLAGSAWLIARGGASGTLTGGQLGGSQAGVRISYALGDARRVAIAVRVATPLSGKGREAAVGVEWRPLTVPLRLVAEQRFALDGGRGGPTLMAVGGVGPVALAPGVRLEAYGEGGGIVRGGTAEAFGDGAARVTHPLGRTGGIGLDLGAGAWGAAQRGARRLDVGPTLGATLPVRHRTLRATLDWRERIAGDARPGSGPALSIGTDF